MKTLALVIGIVFASLAHAQEVVAPNAARLTWVNPTKDTLGVALPASGPGAVIQLRIQRSADPQCLTQFGTVAEQLNLPHTATTALFENLPPGRQCFRVRAVQQLTASPDGVEMLSDWSAVVSKVAAAAGPGKARPPTVTIQ